MEDCAPCRVVGTGAFAGLGAFALWQRTQVNRNLKGQRIGMILVATGAFYYLLQAALQRPLTDGSKNSASIP